MVICRRGGTSRGTSETPKTTAPRPRDGAGPVFFHRRRPSARTLTLLREAKAERPAIRLVPLGAT